MAIGGGCPTVGWGPSIYFKVWGFSADAAFVWHRILARLTHSSVTCPDIIRLHKDMHRLVRQTVGLWTRHVQG